MIRPFTCVCLVLAAGSGLYLYQVKQRAFALDASLRSTFHDIDMAREKTRMLRADWALMNDPERLQALADQYLTLKPMGPSQLMTLDQLAASLPPPIPPGTQVAPPTPDLTAPVADPTHGVPMASLAPATPTGASTDGAAVAMLQPVPQPPAPAVSAPDATADNGGDGSAITVDAAAPDATLHAAEAASVAASAAAMSHAPAAPAPKVAVAVAAVVPRVTHHYTRHVQPAGSAPSGSALADAGAYTPPRPLPHHTHHAKPAAPNAGTQYFAANDASRAPYGGEQITPRAATVMYTPVGSSLGMASAADLAPPRPLYSSTQ